MSGKKAAENYLQGNVSGEAVTLWMEEKKGMERIYLCNLSFYNRKTYSAAIRGGCRLRHWMGIFIRVFRKI